MSYDQAECEAIGFARNLARKKREASYNRLVSHTLPVTEEESKEEDTQEDETDDDS